MKDKGSITTQHYYDEDHHTMLRQVVSKNAVTYECVYFSADGWNISLSASDDYAYQFTKSEEVRSCFVYMARARLGIDDVINFTRRELQVMKLIKDEDLTTVQLGDRLYISPDTVERHIYNIYKKAKVHSRRELILYMARNNNFER